MSNPDQSNASRGATGRVSSRLSNMVLAEDGRNYLAWRTVMPILLQLEPFAWEVVNGDLVEPVVPENTQPTPDQIQQLKNYKLGNSIAKGILFNSLHPNIIITNFYGSTADGAASEIWRLIGVSFNKKSGMRQDAALTRFMSFKYDTRKSVTQNIVKFKELMFTTDEVGAPIDRKVACARLIHSLPRSWDSFKLSWATKSESERDITSLIELILAEAVRRESDDFEPVTALFSKISMGSRHHRVAKPSGNRRPLNRPHNTYGSTGGNPRHSGPNRSGGHNGQAHPNRPKPTCFGCGRVGHYKNECRSSKQTQRHAQPRRRPQALIVENSELFNATERHSDSD